MNRPPPISSRPAQPNAHRLFQPKRRLSFKRLLLLTAWIGLPAILAAQMLRSGQIQVVTQASPSDGASWQAAKLLSEEIEKRIALPVPISKSLPGSGLAIVLQLYSGASIPPAAVPVLPQKQESFRIWTEENPGRIRVIVEGSDSHGLLYGAGYLLRHFIYQKKNLGIEKSLLVSETPDKPLRGHQLGYRNTANSYDKWSASQFEQYIRELVIFGTNAIESIPIFDESTSPHFQLPPDEMNARISAICQKYELQYWIWVPAQFDLKDGSLRMKYIQHLEKIFKLSPRLDGLFFPGGDPGDNPPEPVWALFKEVAPILARYHPRAKIWLSLQGFTPAQNQTAYRLIQQEHPSWFGGLVTGPSSPPVEESRAALPPSYPLRYYPDLTHNVRSDFPVPWWDPCFNFTLGRESVNPRPQHYAAIYQFLSPYHDGFISYSDGIHDDLNKIVWTRLAWNPRQSLREILSEYANLFFESNLKNIGADALLGLEANWVGAAKTNGAVSANYLLWKSLEKAHPELTNNWRWQLYLLRAYYDAYARLRSIGEEAQENQADEWLRKAPVLGPREAIRLARQELEKPLPDPEVAALRSRIIELCDALYRSIGLQTSVKKYQASGEERGAILDFIDYPLNNRWWMEDRFLPIEKLPRSEQDSLLVQIADWENPGPGSYYDDVGNVAKSPHVLRGESWLTDPLSRKQDNPNFDWWEEGFSRQRKSWISSMRWPLGIEYRGLDTAASYRVRITGFGECLLKINGQRVPPLRYGKTLGAFKEFEIPQALLTKREILLTFDEVKEDDINWREQSRITEVWLLKNPQ